MGTLKEAAAAAGVSMSTVSRYLAGKLTVKPQTEAAIIRAVQEVQYHPNLLARSLQSGANLAVVIPNLHNPILSEYMNGMIEALSGSNCPYFFLPCLSRLETEIAICQTLMRRRFDGAIFVNRPRDADPEERHIAALIERGVKVVFLNRTFGAFPISEVYDGLQFGIYAATASLLAQGRRRIGLLLGYGRPHADGVVRFNGYQQALHEVGMPVEDRLVKAASYRYDEALVVVPQFLDEGIDGLVCANDLMAAAALGCLAGRGVRVPDDVAVIGHGDTLISRIATPELSSVDPQARYTGRRAAEVLLALVSGSQKGPLQECVPVSLIVRASSRGGGALPSPVQ